ncbi:MAG: hypothetical protein V4736_10605 [Bdellovibrionota bacterium]
MLEYSLKGEQFILTKSIVHSSRFAFFSGEVGQDAVCVDRSISSYFRPSHWKRLVANTKIDEQKSAWENTVSSDCGKNQKDIQKAVLETFMLDHNGNISQNSFLNCLSKSEETQVYIPAFVEAALTWPKREPPIKINCYGENYNDPNQKESKCPVPSFDLDTWTMRLPQVTNTCKFNPKEKYPSLIRHEIFHRMSPVVPELTINTIIDKCSKKSDEKIEKKIGVNDEDRRDMGKLPNQGHLSEAAFGREVAKAPQVPANIPAVVATNVISPTTPAGERSPAGALSKVFSAPPTGALTVAASSRAISANVFNGARTAVFARAVITPAQAEIPDQPLATTNPVINNVGSTVKPAATFKTQPSQTTESKAIGTAIPVPNGNSQTESQARSDGTRPGSRDTRSIASTPNSQSPSFKNSNSSSIRNSASAPSPIGSPIDKNSQTTQPSRSNAIIQSLTTKPFDEAMVYIQSNQNELRDLGISVLGTRNEILGYPNLGSATHRLRVKGKTIITED